MTDPIKAKIQELCPDVIASQFNHINIDGPLITLAVVLRAINKTKLSPLEKNEAILALIYSKWNLERDNYDQQSEECKQFIGSLLGVV